MDLLSHVINTWLVDTAALSAGFPNVEVRPHRVFGRLQLSASPATFGLLPAGWLFRCQNLPVNSWYTRIDLFA